MNDQQKFVLAVFGLLSLFITVPLAVVLRGWVLSRLWFWFAVPIFGLTPLGIAQAIGVSLIVWMLTHQNINCQSENKEPMERIASALVRVIIYLTHLMGGLYD